MASQADSEIEVSDQKENMSLLDKWSIVAQYECRMYCGSTPLAAFMHQIIDSYFLVTFPLMVKTLKNQKFEIVVAETDTVLEVKHIIQQALTEDHEISFYRLIHHGKIMKDDEKICGPRHNVKDGDFIVLMIKPRTKR